MKRFFPLLFLLGCAAQSPPITPTLSLATLAQITQTDLATAVQIANSVTPPDIEQVQCATFLQTWLPSVTAGHNFIPPTGVVSSFETLRIGAMEAMNVGGGTLTGAQQEQLDMACAPLAVSTARLVAAGALAFGSGTPSSYVKMLLALAKANL